MREDELGRLDAEAIRQVFEARKSFVGAEGCLIGYLVFDELLGQRGGNRGSVLVAAGRAESALKFIELAYDLLKMGYTRVYVLDQRGQGLSGRLIPGKDNYDKTHIDRAGNVVADIAAFVALLPETQSGVPLYLVANITAALFFTRYLQETPRHPFSRVVFIAPLYRLRMPWYKRLLAWLWTRGLFRPAETHYASHEHEYRPVPFADNDRTHCKARYLLADRVVAAVPQASSFGSTVGWAVEVMKTQESVEDASARIEVPTLMLTADEDMLAENRAIERMSQRRFAAAEVVQLQKSRHWILFERDAARDKALAAIAQHLDVAPVQSRAPQPELALRTA